MVVRIYKCRREYTSNKQNLQITFEHRHFGDAVRERVNNREAAKGNRDRMAQRGAKLQKVQAWLIIAEKLVMVM